MKPTASNVPASTSPPVATETCGEAHDSCPGAIQGCCTLSVGHSGAHVCNACGMRF